MYVCMCVYTHTHTHTHTLMADSRCKAETNTTLQCNYPSIKTKKKKIEFRCLSVADFEVAEYVGVFGNQQNLISKMSPYKPSSDLG